MATTYELIAKNVLGSSAASITFSSIPGTYDDLCLVASAMTSETASYGDTLHIKLNNSSSNFSKRYIEANGASVASTYSTTNTIGVVAGTARSGFSSSEFYFANYAGSAYKSFSVTTVDETNATTAYIQLFAALWSNTAAISEINLYAGQSFISGSSFYLYGITKA